MRNLIRKLFGFIVLIILIFLPQSSTCIENKYDSFDKWNEYWDCNNYYPIQMSLSPGEDESVVNFSWYSKEKDKPSKFKIYDKNNNVKNLDVKSINIGNGYVSNKCRVDNLEKESEYYYSYTIDGIYTEKTNFTTKNEEKFSFILMGDPQIGASYKYKNMESNEEAIKIDSYNWNNVLEKALKKRRNASFIISLGDETNTKNDYKDTENQKINNMEFCGFLCPENLKNVPIANVIGNHDKLNIDFYHHFYNPNVSNLGSTKAGSDYYFEYGEVLFLVLNTNNTNINEHRQFIESVVNQKYSKSIKIALFHHDIYGCGLHSNDKDIELLRKQLSPILEENKINIVFNGHDHMYSRTYPIYKDAKSLDNGIIYITLGSCTGSKFYNKTNNLNNNIAYKFNENIPTYSVVDINKNKIMVNTYRADYDEKIDEIITIFN